MRDKLFWLFMLGLLFGSVILYSTIASRQDYRYNKNNEYNKKQSTLSRGVAKT